jgi:hypothetical protein
MTILIVLAFLLGIYFLPTVIAASRGHHNTGAIFALKPLAWMDAARLGSGVRLGLHGDAARVVQRASLLPRDRPGTIRSGTSDRP